jgi:hypothetical protein
MRSRCLVNPLSEDTRPALLGFLKPFFLLRKRERENERTKEKGNRRESFLPTISLSANATFFFFFFFVSEKKRKRRAQIDFPPHARTTRERKERKKNWTNPHAGKKF